MHRTIEVTHTVFTADDVLAYEGLLVCSTDDKRESSYLQRRWDVEEQSDNGITFWPFWLEGQPVWWTLETVAKRATEFSRVNALMRAI